MLINRKTVLLAWALAFAIHAGVPSYGQTTNPIREAPKSKQPASQRGIELATVHAGTRWGFRALENASVTTPIIRLRDVAIPLDPNMAGWQRLSRLAIGLVPLDGHPMTIERRRLTEVIRNVEATPDAIDWVGPKKITVHYQPKSIRQTSYNSTASSPGNSTALQQERSAVALNPAVQQPGNQPAERPIANQSTGAFSSSQDAVTRDVGRNSHPSLTPVEARRIVQSVDRAIKSFLPEIELDFAVEVDRSQPNLALLKQLAAVTNVELLGPLQEGPVPCRISARGVEGMVSADIEMTLTAHPTVVVAKSSLQRGHLISAGDLDFEVIPRERMKPEYITEMSDAIGKEVRSAVSANRPILRDRLGAPILIRRGEGVDLQVVGGGITVTTKARAMEDGAASDLIELEILQPRKRMFGRVVAPGLVEVVTRAPTANPSPRR